MHTVCAPNHYMKRGAPRALHRPHPARTPKKKSLGHLEDVGLQVWLPPRVSLPAEDVASTAQLRRLFDPPADGLQGRAQRRPRGAKDLVRAVTSGAALLDWGDGSQVARGFHLGHTIGWFGRGRRGGTYALFVLGIQNILYI